MGIGEMGQIIGEMGVGKMGVGEMGVIPGRYQDLYRVGGEGKLGCWVPPMGWEGQWDSPGQY